jgi:hypothetical protein
MMRRRIATHRPNAEGELLREVYNRATLVGLEEFGTRKHHIATRALKAACQAALQGGHATREIDRMCELGMRDVPRSRRNGSAYQPLIDAILPEGADPREAGLTETELFIDEPALVLNTQALEETTERTFYFVYDGSETEYGVYVADGAGYSVRTGVLTLNTVLPSYL